MFERYRLQKMNALFRVPDVFLEGAVEILEMVMTLKVKGQTLHRQGHYTIQYWIYFL